MLLPGSEVLKDSHWIKHNSKHLDCKYFYVYTCRHFPKNNKRQISTFKTLALMMEMSIIPKDATDGAVRMLITPFSIRLEMDTDSGELLLGRINLTPCWIFYFNLCFLLICLLKGYCPYIMACLREPCPSAFVQDLSTCGWLQKEEMNTSWSASSPSKVIFLASTPCLWFIDLLCSNQSELGLHDNPTCLAVKKTKHKQKRCCKKFNKDFENGSYQKDMKPKTEKNSVVIWNT